MPTMSRLYNHKVAYSQNMAGGYGYLLTKTYIPIVTPCIAAWFGVPVKVQTKHHAQPLGLMHIIHSWRGNRIGLFDSCPTIE